jgi:ABC-2 type transport system ATP-binding protein
MIRTAGLSKRYGDDVAVDGVDLEVLEGSVHGLVGPNGAGKTTLIALLAGLRFPTSGTVAIGAAPSRVAVLPDTPRFDPWLTGREVVALAAELVGGRDRVDEMLSVAGLTDAARRRVGGYSRGMLQRLGIAASVVGEPAVLLLDEPASALDPLGRREVLDVIGRMRGAATVLFSSHILADVQEVCDAVSVLDRGRLLFQGPIAELLTGSATPRYVVRIRGPAADVAAVFDAEPWVTGVEVLDRGTLAISVTGADEAERGIAGVLAAAGLPVVSVVPEVVTLERAFLELTS